jgi:hypothetical protein
MVLKQNNLSQKYSAQQTCEKKVVSEFAICHQTWAEKAFPISISLVFLGRASKKPILDRM